MRAVFILRMMCKFIELLVVIMCVSDDFLLVIISEIFSPFQNMFQKHQNIDYTKKIYWHLERYKVNKIKLVDDSGEFFNIFKKITFKFNLQEFMLRLWEFSLILEIKSICLSALFVSVSVNEGPHHTPFNELIDHEDGKM